MKLTAMCAEDGDVYLWGWKERVPSGKVFTDLITVGSLQKNIDGKQSSPVAEQGVDHHLCMEHK